jgi:hypothetical protein
MLDKIRIAPSCYPATSLDPRSNLAESIRNFAEKCVEDAQILDLPEDEREWLSKHLKYSAETILIHFGLLSAERQRELDEKAKIEADRIKMIVANAVLE